MRFVLLMAALAVGIFRLVGVGTGPSVAATPVSLPSVPEALAAFASDFDDVGALEVETLVAMKLFLVSVNYAVIANRSTERPVTE